jgi:hypothetical protein
VLYHEAERGLKEVLSQMSADAPLNGDVIVASFQRYVSMT